MKIIRGNCGHIKGGGIITIIVLNVLSVPGYPPVLRVVFGLENPGFLQTNFECMLQENQ